MRWNRPLLRHQCARVVVVANATRGPTKGVTTIGLGQAKQVFQGHGADGAAIIRGGEDARPCRADSPAATTS